MNWKDTLQKKLSQGFIDDFNEVALRLINERGKVSAGEVFDNLPKKLSDIMNTARVASYLKKIPEVEYSGKPGSGAGHYTLKKSIEKSSSFIQAVVDRILTDEWITTTELHQRSLDLTQTNKKTEGRPYKRTLGKGQLVNRLISRGIAETKAGNKKNETLIRRKQ